METRGFFLGDVVRGHRWLGHDGAYTEVSILHPQYRPGDHDWNRRYQAWPITRYIRRTSDLCHLVSMYTGERLICYGVNPRQEILRYENGRVRSAKEDDLLLSQNIILDLDLVGSVTSERLARIPQFISSIDEYFASKGLQRPVRASTGRGSHLLFAYPPLTITECPDVKERLQAFKKEVTTIFRNDLERLEARIDNTQDLRRMVRTYGTSKPDIGIISKFYGKTRTPDPALRDHLLQLTTTKTMTIPVPKDIIISNKPPDWFAERLINDQELNNLWHGRGKPTGTDTSNSGYDYTIARHLATTTNANDNEIATIISSRPNGQDKRARQRTGYLRRTIHAARKAARNDPRHDQSQ